ncbi:MAG: hypothetical protein IT170_18465 [Bryobacterales bacterium]|nr:hypothetical protein [Bryobacterales bacterium]
MPKQKPWRKKCLDPVTAHKTAAEWEDIRMRYGAANRMRPTIFSAERLRDAEEAWAVAKKLGFSTLMDAVLAAKPKVDATEEKNLPTKTYQELFAAFVPYHKEHASKSQSDKVRQDAKRFGDFVGWSTDIKSIALPHFTEWLGKPTTTAEKKTFNNRLNNVSRVFSWACEPAQKFLEENPANAIERYSNRVLGQGARMILSPERCAELMAYIEKHHKEWVFPFALLLFAGVRPGYHDGEIRKLMECANRDGIETYLSGGVLHISAEIAKDRRARQFHLPANLIAWVEKYMPTKGQFALGSSETYAEIRSKFRIPHDGLRHTSISAHIAMHNAFAVAAVEFGNSETIIRRHYYSRMTKAQAGAFYSILPRTTR